MSFWQIETSVPVVFKPCPVHASILGDRRQNEARTYVSQEEEREEVHEGVGQLLVLLERDPDLLPSNRQVVFSLRKSRPRTRLLEDNCIQSVSHAYTA